MLTTFHQSLTYFTCIVGWLKVTKQRSFQGRPTHYISLDTIPGICQSIQQSYSNLPLLDIILQIYKLKVCVELMEEPRDSSSIHLSRKAEV